MPSCFQSDGNLSGNDRMTLDSMMCFRCGLNIDKDYKLWMNVLLWFCADMLVAFITSNQILQMDAFDALSDS